MAETFAIDPGQSPQQGMTQVPGVAMPGSGIGFSNPQATTAAGQQGSKTAQLLMKLASDTLAPKVQAEARKQFFNGMQQAMSGEALTEIVDQSPWYANIFGPAAAVQGARQYTQESTIAKWAAGVESQMPELAKQDPSQIGSLIYGQLEGMFTGDTEADSRILASATEMMGPILKQHTKAHYAYTQNRANEAQLNTWGAQADILNGLMSDSTASPEDREASRARFLGQINPMEGQTEESYQKNIAGLLKGTAERGQFQVLNLMRTTKTPDGKTVWDMLPYSTRTTIDSQLPQYGALAIKDALPKFGLELELITNDTAQDPRGILARVQAFNEKVAQATGVPVDIAQAIPTNQLLQMTGGVLRAQAAQAAAGKDDAASYNLANSLVTRPGQLASYKALGMIKDKHAEQAMGQAWSATPDPAARANMLNANPTIKSDLVTAGIMADVGTSVYSDAVLIHAETVKNLNESGMAGYPPTQLAKLQQFNRKVAEGWAPEQAWTMAPQFMEISKSNIRTKNMSDFEQSIKKVVQKENPWLSTIVGDYGNELTPSARTTAYAILNKDIEIAGGGGGLDQDTATASAYYRAIKTNTMQVYGKHVASVANPNSAVPLSTLVLGTQQELSEAFDAAFQAKAKAAGIPTDQYYLARMPDQGGLAVFGVNAVDEKGKPYNFMMSSEDIKQHLRAIQEPRTPGSPNRPKGQPVVGGRIGLN